MTFHSMFRNGSRRRFVFTAVMLTLVAVLLTAAYYLTYEPAPLVRVRWREGMTDDRRVQLEREFLLVRPVPHEGRTLSYDLLDTRASNVAALVAHPDVEDTDHLNRAEARVPFDAPYGESWMWIGHRTPVLRTVLAYWWQVSGGPVRR
jgi:hypothetical protein